MQFPRQLALQYSTKEEGDTAIYGGYCIDEGCGDVADSTGDVADSTGDSRPDHDFWDDEAIYYGRLVQALYH